MVLSVKVKVALMLNKKAVKSFRKERKMPTEYSQKQKQAFVKEAMKTSINEAMKEFGYPKYRITAKKWIEKSGYGGDNLQNHTSQNEKRYTNKELIGVNERTILRAFECLENPNLKPSDVKSIATAIEVCQNNIARLGGEPIAQDSIQMDKDIEKLLNRWESKAG